MRVIKLTISYDGTDFCGWQAQAEGRTVQATLETAWQNITGEFIRFTASGRTDAGVHALGQVVSARTCSSFPLARLPLALNANLPADVRVLQAEDAPEDFCAILSARGKTYRYLIQDRPAHNVFWRRYAWHQPKQLDRISMQAAANLLIGEHDFQAFQGSGSPRKTTVRHVRRLTVDDHATELAPLLRIEIEANGFLYNMVRNIVGTLVEVGKGRAAADWVGDVLRSCDRTHAGPTAPPQGLALVHVEYPKCGDTS
ncbi:MAG: tRNA pseudouridine(38-40) synthase TruA [Planctomycetales bacterium]|nr:tRNA pseudouridine(38-40) synthase TruA [Planctomycetales bacterium]